MWNKISKSRYFLFLICLFLEFSVCFAQTIEQAYDLRLKGIQGTFGSYMSYTDTTQVTDDGFHPLKIRFGNEDSSEAFRARTTDDCFLYWSTIVVLPTNAGKERCTVTLNCKGEFDLLRFVAVVLDKDDNELYTDSVHIHPTAQWTDYSLAFCRKEARAVKIIFRYNGSAEANKGQDIYLNRVIIRVGNQEINNLPIASLVQSKNIRLKDNAIIPLSLQDDASFANVHDWKDKKLIALGEGISGIGDLWEAQVQCMKHLITSENCKLILLELPEDLCVRWNLYLQGKQSAINEERLFEELKYSQQNYTVFFEFLKWIRQYNMKVNDPVRIIGTGNIGDFYARNICLADYLLKLSTSRQDSAYYVHAVDRFEYSEVKEHILQSQLSTVMKEQDFQYLLFLMDEMIHAHAKIHKKQMEDSDLDKADRIERIIDIYLSSAEKAVIIAPSERINKRFPIRDLDLRSDLLGSCLYQKYGKQYHAVSFQVGGSTCPISYLLNGKHSFEGKSESESGFGYHLSFDTIPVAWEPPFPFAFERAGMDSQVPCFYYPSGQLPDAILGLTLFVIGYRDRVPFRYCNITSHFDALVFIREAKAMRDFTFYPRRHSLSQCIRDVGLNLDVLLKDIRMEESN